MELLEEEPEVACLLVLRGVGHLPICLAQTLAQRLRQLRSLLRGGDALVFDVLEVDVGSRVPGGHEVVVIYELDESLDLGSPDKPLLGHPPGDIPGGSVNTHDQGTGELPGFVALIVALDDDSLLPRVPARCKNDDSPSFEDFAHCGLVINNISLNIDFPLKMAGKHQPPPRLFSKIAYRQHQDLLGARGIISAGA